MYKGGIGDSGADGVTALKSVMVTLKQQGKKGHCREMDFCEGIALANVLANFDKPRLAVEGEVDLMETGNEHDGNSS